MSSVATSARETVLVLGEELERRVAAAARLRGLDPDDFIVQAVQSGVAEVLGEPGQAGRLDDQSSPDRGWASHDVRGGWAIRPTSSRVLRLVAQAAGLSIETIASHSRSSSASKARAVAAYLLRNDVGLTALDKPECCT